MKHFKPSLAVEARLIDMTPLVDVVFLLLVFFVLSTDVLPHRAIKIDPPELAMRSPQISAQVLVMLDADHTIYLGQDKRVVDLTDIKQQLNQEIESLKQKSGGVKPSVMMSVDKRVEYQYFLRLFTALQECSTSIGLVYHSVGIEVPEKATIGNHSKGG
jgi:biopolymer transport protein ExbD